MARERIKGKALNIRVSDSFIMLLKELADKKGMSQANLIEYLVRKEADSMQLKERFQQEEIKEGDE
ncbi:RepB family protein [Capnocytophaga sputigena]|uniref:RepB family protein n=1 Tax=Capnocytophaga sputigena TaxID=1019 RepID=UPI00288BC8E6|nr:RepB family protein [Capnocytophaga sputigena]